MQQELNRKQMEKNSTKVIYDMIYLGQKLKNFPNQKNLPSGSQFSQKELEKGTNIWVTDGKSLVLYPSWVPWFRCAVGNTPDWIAQVAEKLQNWSWGKGVEIVKSHCGSNFINSNEIFKL